MPETILENRTLIILTLLLCRRVVKISTKNQVVEFLYRALGIYHLRVGA